MVRRFCGAFTLIAAILTSPEVVATGPTCVGDVDGNALVETGDLLQVVDDWGPCVGCPADVDRNGVVDSADLLLVLLHWGPCPFDYGEHRENAEAEQIALEMLGVPGPLRVRDDLYDRIERDQRLIREFEPRLVAEEHSPAWRANELIVRKIPDRREDEYEQLNAYFGVVDEEALGFGNWFLLTFPDSLNIPAVAAIYMALDAIEYAHPNGLIGGDNDWEPQRLADRWRWFIEDGFLDCLDGCDCVRRYTIDVTHDGTVTLVAYEERGASYCEF